MTDQHNEFARPVKVEALPPDGKRLTIEADGNERQALAARFGVEAVETLQADVEILPIADGDIIRVRGRLRAQVVQPCVVTLNLLTSDIDETFETDYSFSASDALPVEVEHDLDSEDIPEMIIDGQIDVGEEVAEQLSLAIEPYPRTPGAEFEAPTGIGQDEPDRQSPFAKLAELKQKMR